MVNSSMLLACEANSVIALRIMKLMRGGRSAHPEAELMVSEKIHAAFEATASFMAGASGDEIVHRYRRHVAAPNGSLSVYSDRYRAVAPMVQHERTSVAKDEIILHGDLPSMSPRRDRPHPSGKPSHVTASQWKPGQT